MGRHSMDELSIERFNDIVGKDLNDLSDGDIAFIRGRRAYLSKKQEEKFAKILVIKKDGKKEKKN